MKTTTASAPTVEAAKVSILAEMSNAIASVRGLFGQSAQDAEFTNKAIGLETAARFCGATETEINAAKAAGKAKAETINAIYAIAASYNTGKQRAEGMAEKGFTVSGENGFYGFAATAGKEVLNIGEGYMVAY